MTKQKYKNIFWQIIALLNSMVQINNYNNI